MAAPFVEQLVQSKLVLLGEMGSGKTSLVQRFVRGQYFENQVGGTSAVAATSCNVAQQPACQPAAPRVAASGRDAWRRLQLCCCKSRVRHTRPTCHVRLVC